MSSVVRRVGRIGVALGAVLALMTVGLDAPAGALSRMPPWAVLCGDVPGFVNAFNYVEARGGGTIFLNWDHVPNCVYEFTEPAAPFVNNELDNGLPNITVGNVVIDGGSSTVTASAGDPASGGSSWPFGFVEIKSPSASLTAHDLTVTGFSGSPEGPITNWGSLKLSNVVMSHNAGMTGAIANNAGRVSLTSSEIDDNAGQRGGAIVSTGQVTVDASTFNGNQTTWIGGAILNSGLLTVSNSTFLFNTAWISGGAIGNDLGRMTMTGSTVGFNSVGPSSVSYYRSGFGGAGIWSDAQVTITNSQLNFNTVVPTPDPDGVGSKSAGGGILIDAGGYLSVSSSTIRNNNAPGGGGVAIAAQATGAYFNSVSFQSNTGGAGGAIRTDGTTLPIVLLNSTLDANTASFGGALAAKDALILSNNSTYSNNEAETGGGIGDFYATLVLTGGSIHDNTATKYGGGGIYHAGGKPGYAINVTFYNNIPDNCGGSTPVSGCP
jgi:predicted outer membrane repeat protein